MTAQLKKYFSSALFLGLLIAAPAAMGAITGTVFNDGNNNGAMDATEVGYPHLAVSAFAAGSGTPAATAVTDAAGQYSLSGLTPGASYRIEFALPPGFFPAAFGSGSNTSIQFADEGEAGVDFGLYVPGTCGTDPDPRIIGTCGLVSGSGGISTVSWLFASQSFPQSPASNQNYNGVSHPHSDDIASAQVGVPWAMARIPETQLVAIAPMASPRTSIFGSGGANGITALYLANYAGAAKAFVDQKLLVQMDTLGIAGLTFDAQAPIGATQPRFGEYGYGGLEISPDGNFLYAANLGKRNLLKIDISGVDYAQLPTTAPTAADVVEISLPATYAGFTDGVEGYFRPTAMSEYAGVIYIGGTFDGSLLVDDSAVRIVVLALDPADDSITEVFSYDPTAFTRGNFSYKGGIHTRWTAAPESGGGFTNPVPPMQPVVSDLTFDDYGALNLGVTDRSVYNLNSSNQVGYSIGTWRNPDGSFTLESGNSRGPLAGATVGTGTSPFDRVSPDGPGGQFFYDQSEGHPFLYSGGLLNIPGTDTVLGGWADALDINAFGVRYNKTSDGQIKGGIHLGGGKQFAIVGVDAVCELGPIEIGNRVWQDLDDNGVQDAGEPAIAGVTVQLLDGSGAVISSVATTPDGNYVFSSDPARADAPGADYGIAGFAHGGTYTVRIPDAQGGSQQAALSGLFLIPKNGGADTIDSDADLSGGDAVVAVATGMEGENSHDYDFGFSASPPPCAISEIVVTAGPCNDNGTPGNAGDDFYLAAVTVGFASPPATGSLALTGDASASVPVGSLDSATSHTFSGVVLPADGAAKSITATFSADPACTLTNPAIAAVNACSSCAAAAALLAKP